MTLSRCLPILLVASGAMAVAACGHDAPAKSAPPAKVANPVKEADLTTLTLTEEAERRLGIETAVLAASAGGEEREVGGDTLVPPGRVVPVTAPVAGRIEGADGGSSAPQSLVRQNQDVFRLVPLAAPPRDVRVTYEAEVAAATARFDAARQQRDRATQMLKDEVGSRRSLEQAQQEFAQAQAALNAATGRLARLGATPLDSDITVPVSAPFDGTVLRWLVAPGQIVAAGAVLFEVGDLRTLWVRVPVYVGDLAAYASVHETTVRALGQNGAAPRRRATRVNGPPAADALASSADLFFQFDNRDGAFRPGQKVAVSLASASAGSALTVPAAAVAYDYQGGAWVYVNTAPHTFVRRRVDVARTVGTHVVLARGPEPGVKVVVAGVAELFGTEFGAGK